MMQKAFSANWYHIYAVSSPAVIFTCFGPFHSNSLLWFFPLIALMSLLFWLFNR
jgi:hypothetical protein